MLLKYNPFKKALHYVYLSFFILLCLVVSTNSDTKEESDDSHQEISQPKIDKPLNKKINPKKKEKNTFAILKEAPHNPKSFTQGFDYENGVFYESSGLYKKSFIESYNDKERLNHKKLSKDIFSEGLVKVGANLFVLTWKSQTLSVLDAQSLKVLTTKTYKGEGWGITHDGKQFIMSNGSSELSFRNKEFQITKRIIVRDGHTTYTKINELEYANGYIWANVWQSNYILKIDLETGDVLSRYDLSELAKINSKRPKHTVLNGLAYDEKSDAFWVTGKFWPRRYLIRFE